MTDVDDGTHSVIEIERVIGLREVSRRTYDLTRLIHMIVMSLNILGRAVFAFLVMGGHPGAKKAQLLYYGTLSGRLQMWNGIWFGMEMLSHAIGLLGAIQREF